ncbi:2-polyprenyl-6-methoxyphenol hydroxylase and related FAD-dependent oxidoreductases [Thiohalobacter thiocyanaticus]|uniref:2-polyprenyl-6-methoxyphenol hydroxylase and related FAD-dependent oxidoreductases n=1 Tax=Thiohalobacter thiocyanaticus TaxID=585455 RepID=A0A1Z4VUE9_9GAMM|nr:UbiH/UbiF/VisC/COQ6 family ubiquinone biosynthesis hydroxylase [Thiohalobacter thiocyanaticus]BAZ95267.1 2-polyprenyl-6-methoxyphenol hydroxylase and related FAD-dependent oxidoreductases [Thiohalobacter thiocyanaticus]
MPGSVNTHDVIISGGGVVGASLACTLADAGLRIALIDTREPVTDWPADSIDQRVYAVTCASQTLFERLGVWEGIRQRGVSPYQAMEVWDAAGPGRIHFDAAELGEPWLGHIVEQRVIQAALLDGQRARPGLERICPGVLADFQLDPAGVSVRLEDGRELTAALLVGADGAGSRVRELAGIGIETHDYEQTAVVAVVATDRPHAGTAWQRFLPTGPLAFLPLRDGRCSIVWSTTPEEAERLLALPEDEFCIELGQAFDYELGAITRVNARGGFPLRRLHAVDYVQQRLALVGDAAHVIHPLAGQGVNLGLLDVAALAEVVADTAAAGRDIGAHANLRRYERWRRGENALMQSAMDGFKWLFASPLTPVRLLRNLGLGTVDRLTPVKSLLARHAMGRAGDLPRLVRPDS